jgi:cytidine deaminase
MIRKEIITAIEQLNSVSELQPDEQIMVEKAIDAAAKAYAPYSKFRVGACVLLANGLFFEGSNQENAAYPSGLCAERVAMFYANAQFPDVAVTKIAVVAFNGQGMLQNPISPCGSCRQVLLESEQRSGSPLKVILVGKPEVFVVNGAYQLLPLSFGKASL